MDIAATEVLQISTATGSRGQRTLYQLTDKLRRKQAMGFITRNVQAIPEQVISTVSSFESNSIPVTCGARGGLKSLLIYLGWRQRVLRSFYHVPYALVLVSVFQRPVLARGVSYISRIFSRGTICWSWLTFASIVRLVLRTAQARSRKIKRIYLLFQARLQIAKK
ncbi:hypothetical protein R1flu_016044 [Riccia fluitans]|uniref:Uncharacterized protein n=1 Tax=Riccia fluitans TaxID=41844 RepID=A0ABD1YL77_9MARC